jgi:uncharacterized protein (TIGR03032 family)
LALDQKISLAISTYQAGKLILVGFDNSGNVSVQDLPILRSMGIAADESARNLYVAGLHSITRFVDAIQPGQANLENDRVYIPQVTYTTADINTHDMAVDHNGRLIFTNTLFSCLCTLSDTHSFVPIWQPPFITDLKPEDRCHMNGFCLDQNGEPAYATAVSDTNLAGGWRDNRKSGGVVIDIQKNEIISRGLPMPHSPRMHEGELYLQNAGTGYLGKVNLEDGKFEEIIFLPGFLRGLTFTNHYAICSVSKNRNDRTFKGLDLDNNLKKNKVNARCGVYIIDLLTGSNVHSIEAEGFLEEIYDVLALKNVQRPKIIGFEQSDINRLYVFGENQDTYTEV